MRKPPGFIVSEYWRDPHRFVKPQRDRSIVMLNRLVDLSPNGDEIIVGCLSLESVRCCSIRGPFGNLFDLIAVKQKGGT